MKKVFNKLGAAFLAVCLTFSCFTFVTHAASGTLQFSDPSGAAGDTVSVTAKVSTGGAAIGDTDITVTYDTSLLKFKSGTNVTGSDGTLKLSTKGDGTSTEASYSMEFTALKEGTATLKATDYTAYLYNNDSLNLSLGTSQVTIQGGTPVTDAGSAPKSGKAEDGAPKVQVNGKTYTVNANFSQAVIPNGFEESDTQLDGKNTKAMLQKSSGQYLYYLEDSDGNSDYYLYSSEDGSFTPTEAIDITPDVTIFLMNHKDKEGLPPEYKSTTTDIGGKEFSAWQDTSQKEYYLVYALSSDGKKDYYKYDTTEKTYQRFTLPVVQKTETKNALSDKIFNFVKTHMTLIMCAAWGAFLLLLIIIIILAVKLTHRNHELDDLYDEYGLDDMGEPEEQAKKKKGGKKSAPLYDDFDDDEEYGDDDFADEEYSDDEYEDDDFSDAEYSGDEYEDDEFSDVEYLGGEYEDDDFSEAEYTDDEYEDDDFSEAEYSSDEYEDDPDEEYTDDEYDEDDDFEDYDEKAAKRPSGRRKKKGDNYSVDFIDI